MEWKSPLKEKSNHLLIINFYILCQHNFYSSLLPNLFKVHLTPIFFPILQNMNHSEKIKKELRNFIKSQRIYEGLKSRCAGTRPRIWRSR